MNYNKFGIKPDDIVILDKGSRNSLEVKVLHVSSHSGLFCTVCLTDNEAEKWDVMTSRLTPKDK